ncbi:class I SAM-dependent methyltransferase [Blautia sp. MSJ-19]|uniref:class I SAM-dependent methyltransferase n=1 Tax=Blautia sp. MSJ-19 TaxID=2841517 RepID=UPI001C0EA264|nr:class I SAM-dependent methyltransferase [Blautia sp. MSJ-19]MBU5480687.1 methyltransferase domain-containing protein [Blautia sp. MSJ-19]
MGDWNAVLYDNKHDFVAEYGKGLLEFVPENKNQSILDLGCGTGMLTAQLSNFADTIIGVDSSASMIAKAKKQYSNMQFVVCDALDLPFEKQFDVVFSNAVFHWIADHDTLLKQVYKVLKPNGLLICEFGANGNIATIENAFMSVCQDFEYKYKPKFNFPTVDTFSGLLKKNNFMIDKIYDYNRTTPLKDHERGLANWIRQFFASDLELMSEKTQEEIIKKVEDLTKEYLWNGDEWIADYRRLRAIAHI